MMADNNTPLVFATKQQAADRMANLNHLVATQDGLGDRDILGIEYAEAANKGADGFSPEEITVAGAIHRVIAGMKATARKAAPVASDEDAKTASAIKVWIRRHWKDEKDPVQRRAMARLYVVADRVIDGDDTLDDGAATGPERTIWNLGREAGTGDAMPSEVAKRIARVQVAGNSTAARKAMDQLGQSLDRLGKMGRTAGAIAAEAPNAVLAVVLTYFLLGLPRTSEINELVQRAKELLGGLGLMEGQGFTPYSAPQVHANKATGRQVRIEVVQNDAAGRPQYHVTYLEQYARRGGEKVLKAVHEEVRPSGELTGHDLDFLRRQGDYAERWPEPA
jgi:hypothetical protein